MLPHYYLLSDYKVGYIDRHNYFGGTGSGMFASMLSKPGSGYFGSGLEQVVDRPFALSEWISVYPNVYAAEGPAIVAAYGMGLQGWDASYEFQSQANRQVFGNIAGKFPWGVWEADVPTSLGQFSALARMIYRGDVKEGEVISVRRVSPTDLAEGRFSFSDKVEQHGDVKSFSGSSVPPEALAAGRVVVEFTDKSRPSQLPDMKRYRSGSVIKSVTGQLAWDTSGKSYFTVNTAATKAVVGHASGKELTLGDVKVRLDSPFASLFLTALGREDLASGKRALITVLARQSNTGFKYFTPDNKVLANGEPPILLEPVKAAVTIAGRTVGAVNVLDHDGRRTGRTLSVKDGRFTLDGAKDKAIYYEVVFR
jgi:hypothetical protein